MAELAVGLGQVEQERRIPRHLVRLFEVGQSVRPVTEVVGTSPLFSQLLSRLALALRSSWTGEQRDRE
jgi:hypothetical protein